MAQYTITLSQIRHAAWAGYFSAFLVVSPGVIAGENDAARYETCMDLVERDAEKAFDEAIDWQGVGGGSPAEHCAAAALLALGYHDEAAVRLEALAQKPGLDGTLKPDILRQSALAWLSANEPERAFAALTAAIGLAPTDAELWQDRGLANAEMARYEEAIGDLSQALVLSPDDARTWLLRGSAYRLTEQLAEAAQDIGEAIRLDPENLEAYLERGNLRRVQGDNAGARQDWLKVLRAAPESELADTARTNLQRMDVSN